MRFITNDFQQPAPPVTRRSGGLGWWWHPIPQGSSIFVNKPYRKARTHSQEVEWWRTFMVECVWIFKLYQLQFVPPWQAYLLLLWKQEQDIFIL